MTPWKWYWLVWLLAGFLGPETWALATNPRNTLSDTVWDWFGVMTSQPIRQWSVQHYALLAFMVWLTVHFVWRIWR